MTKKAMVRVIKEDGYEFYMSTKAYNSLTEEERMKYFEEMKAAMEVRYPNEKKQDQEPKGSFFFSFGQRTMMHNNASFVTFDVGLCIRKTYDY